MKPQILIADDNEAILSVARRIFEKADFDATVARDGTSALLVASQQTFDVALIDYQMPPMSGIEVLAQLRKIQPSCVGMLMSGGLDMGVTLEAVNRGQVSGVVVKPFVNANLVESVRNALAKYQSASDHYQLRKKQLVDGERAALLDLLQTGAIELALQPIISAQDSTTVAYEALCRSRHPAFVGPAAMFQAAERYGMIVKLGAAVIARAADIVPNLPTATKLFVNLHPLELTEPSAIEAHIRPLIPFAKQVVLEITESYEHRLDSLRASVAELSHLGFGIAVDDIGTGYNSLAVLAEVQPDFIKIDMGLVRDCHLNGRKSRLIATLCAFATATDTQIIAEGIEVDEEGETVKECGAGLLQGYLFGRPQPAAALNETHAAAISEPT